MAGWIFWPGPGLSDADDLERSFRSFLDPCYDWQKKISRYHGEKRLPAGVKKPKSEKPPEIQAIAWNIQMKTAACC
jgi:hypothetical protein